MDILFKAHATNLDQSYKLALYQSWHAEAFRRTKRLPKLDKILKTNKKQNKSGNKAKNNPQSVDQQLKLARMITSAF